MAGFLFTLWPFPGHVHPNVAIARVLRRRGHDVAFYTGGSVRALLEAEGLRCLPFQQVDEARVESIVLALDAMSLEWWKARRQKALLRAWLLGTIEPQLADLRAHLAAWRPDVLVGDPAMWAPLLVLQERSRIPLAIMSYCAACMLPGPEGPILGLPLPRARGSLARFGRRLLRAVASVAAADVRRAANGIRAGAGLSPLRTSVTAFAGQMPLYLVPSTPGLDRDRHDLPPSVRYVGHCHWERPHREPPPAWLADLPADRAVVYVTEGTLHAKAPRLLRAALHGLAPLPVEVIATTGRHRDPATLDVGVRPANARVEQWVPHSDLLPRCDVVVTTGGTGTVMAALAAGKPLVIVPMAWDQPENAWRVVEAGAGVRVAPQACTPEGIRDAVRRVLGDPSFRMNASRVAADLERYGGATLAADLLEELACGPARRTRAAAAASSDRPRPPAGDTVLHAAARVSGQ